MVGCNVCKLTTVRSLRPDVPKQKKQREWRLWRGEGGALGDWKSLEGRDFGGADKSGYKWLQDDLAPFFHLSYLTDSKKFSNSEHSRVVFSGHSQES